MRRVFVDTSAFVAVRNRRDANHAAARAAHDDLLRRGVQLFTSNFVFAETYTALLVRVDRSEAVAWGRAMRHSEAIEILRIDEQTEEDAWALLESHTDKRWSYVDATSFLLMEREGSSEAFVFDHDFAQRGLRMLPG